MLKAVLLALAIAVTAAQPREPVASHNFSDGLSNVHLEALETSVKHSEV